MKARCTCCTKKESKDSNWMLRHRDAKFLSENMNLKEEDGNAILPMPNDSCESTFQSTVLSSCCTHSTCHRRVYHSSKEKQMYYRREASWERVYAVNMEGSSNVKEGNVAATSQRAVRYDKAVDWSSETIFWVTAEKDEKLLRTTTLKNGKLDKKKIYTRAGNLSSKSCSPHRLPSIPVVEKTTNWKGSYSRSSCS